MHQVLIINTAHTISINTQVHASTTYSSSIKRSPLTSRWTVVLSLSWVQLGASRSKMVESAPLQHNVILSFFFRITCTHSQHDIGRVLSFGPTGPTASCSILADWIMLFHKAHQPDSNELLRAQVRTSTRRMINWCARDTARQSRDRSVVPCVTLAKVWIKLVATLSNRIMNLKPHHTQN